MSQIINPNTQVKAAAVSIAVMPMSAELYLATHAVGFPEFVEQPGTPFDVQIEQYAADRVEYARALLKAAGGQI